MTMIPVKSSMIESVGHDPGTKDMHVTFVGGGTHAYSGVSAAVHSAFVNSPSLGKHFAKHIRFKYQGRKFTPTA
jgi:hypothetical protein